MKLMRVIPVFAIAVAAISCSNKGDFECECTTVGTDQDGNVVGKQSQIWFSENDIDEDLFKEECEEGDESYKLNSIQYEETCKAKEI